MRGIPMREALMTAPVLDAEAPARTSRLTQVLNRFGGLLQIAAILFVATVFWRGLVALEANRVTTAGLALTLGFAFFIGFAAFVAQICGLRVLIESLTGGAVPFRRAFFFQGRTAIAKYLPGNVFHFVGRQLLARQLGWTQRAVLLTSAAEVTVLLAAPCAVALAGLLMAPADAALGIPRLIVAAALACGLAGPFAAIASTRLVSGFPRLAAVLSPLRTLSCRTWAAALLWNVLFFACGTAALALGLRLFAQQGLTLSEAPALTFAFAASCVAGLLTPGAPGGVGVREALLILFLGPLFGSGPVSAAAILARLGSILAECLAWVLTRLQHEDGSQVP